MKQWALLFCASSGHGLENNCPAVIKVKCALAGGSTASIISSLVCVFESFVCVP